MVIFSILTCRASVKHPQLVNENLSEFVTIVSTAFKWAVLLLTCAGGHVANTGKPTWHKNLETMLIVLLVCNASYVLLTLGKSVRLIVNFIKM